MRTALATDDGEPDRALVEFTLTRFNEMEAVAIAYLDGHPVLLNTPEDRDEARRMLDFSAGLGFGTGGLVEKVGVRRYVLQPKDRPLTAAERRSLSR